MHICEQGVRVGSGEVCKGELDSTSPTDFKSIRLKHDSKTWRVIGCPKLFPLRTVKWDDEDITFLFLTAILDLR